MHSASEELAARGPLTEEQTAELAALRSKAAGQGRKKKDRDVTETGVGGVLVVGRVAGPEGESGETGADQVDLDVWSADADLDGWLDRAVDRRRPSLRLTRIHLPRRPLRGSTAHQPALPNTLHRRRQTLSTTHRRLGSAPQIRRALPTHAGDGDGVDLLDPQKGEEAEAADVLTATGMWVIPVPGAEVEGEVVLPPSGSGLRRQGGASGLPAEVTGQKRRRGVSGPVAGGADASAGSSEPTRVGGVRGGRLTRVRGGRLARVRGGLSGGKWTQPLLLRLLPGVRAMAGVRCAHRRSQPTAADIILGGPEQVAWRDGRLLRVAELLDVPESVRLERLGGLAGIAEMAELAGRIERHLEAMPPGFDPDGQYAPL
ncbi:hypothetical protein [Saccharopolyspora spinosa]|uniref:hypothetical protein n=1 Tax=Saccharopolyspora spinosa TaxID=60894 RepID=UPI000237B4A2|nr:hypothetical protein [Saccharopolyspora spinosa]